MPDSDLRLGGDDATSASAAVPEGNAPQEGRFPRLPRKRPTREPSPPPEPKPKKPSPWEDSPRGQRKSFEGYVVSAKMQKTVVVEVVKNTRHPRYGKVVPQTVKYKAHDELDECREGDLVRIYETRPISKTKYFRVSDIVTKAR